MDVLCENEDISFIKLDVEGYEKFVLEGSKTILQNDNLKVLIVEINFSNKFYNVKNDEITDFLGHYNFKPYKYDPLNRKLSALDSHNKDQFNTIFIKDLNFVENRIKESVHIHLWDQPI